MKISISVPDDLLRQMKASARRRRISRSELCTMAIAEFLKKEGDRAIMERLNDVYSRVDSKLDAGFHRAQLETLAKYS